MNRSNSFPGAALDPTASEQLASRLAAELSREAAAPAQPLRSKTDASVSSDDLDSESFGEEWSAASDTSTPLR